MNRRVSLCVALGVAAAVWTASARSPGAQTPQQPTATFRAVVNYIEIDASVTDSRGEFVRDVRLEEFEILEQGRRQDLTVFLLVDIPLERADRPLYRPTAVEPDVATNEAVDDGRLYVIVLDGYHIAAARSSDVRRQARLFIERYLGANDLAAVVQIGNPSAGQEFTSNKRLLLESADKFLGQKLDSSVRTTMADAMANLQMGLDVPPRDTEEPVRAYMAEQSMASVERISQSLAAVTGRRKSLLLFSEGIDYDMMDGPVEVAGQRAVIRDAGRVTSAQSSMIAAATRSNVAIYSIDPRGLTTGFEDAILMSGLPPGQGAPLAAMGDALKRSHETLRAFAAETGGRALVSSNDMAAGFDRVMRDNSTYYLLGYNSNAARDGRFHNVRVRVTRPGLEVRARTGYHAPFEDSRARAARARTAPVDPLTALVGAPMPAEGLGLRATAAVAGGSSKLAKVHLTVEMRGEDVGFDQRAGLFHGGVDLEYQVLDDKGRVAASDRKEIGLRLLQTNRDLVTDRGLRYVGEFDLAPGRYHLRLAARARVTGRTGSVFMNLTLPDFSKEALGLGDLLITAASAQGTITSGVNTRLGAQLPGPTTTARAFDREDTLAVGATVHVADASRTYTVDIRTSLRADDGTRVFSRDDQRDSREIGRDPAGYLSVVAIPLTTLAPGSYVLSVEARSRLGGEPVVRETSIVVR